MTSAFLSQLRSRSAWETARRLATVSTTTEPILSSFLRGLAGCYLCTRSGDQRNMARRTTRIVQRRTGAEQWVASWSASEPQNTEQRRSHFPSRRALFLSPRRMSDVLHEPGILLLLHPAAGGSIVCGFPSDSLVGLSPPKVPFSLRTPRPVGEPRSWPWNRNAGHAIFRGALPT